MAANNASSVGDGQQWRHELRKNSEQQCNAGNQGVPKNPNVPAFQSQMMASAVCCSKTNCDKFKLEMMPEQFFRFEPVQTSSLGMNGSEGGNRQPSKKKDARATPPPEPLMPFCPCMLSSGQLVTYCCMRRDCDDATKIGTVPRERKAHKQFKF